MSKSEGSLGPRLIAPNLMLFVSNWPTSIDTGPADVPEPTAQR
jgi:hypothetical protein